MPARYIDCREQIGGFEGATSGMEVIELYKVAEAVTSRWYEHFENVFCVSTTRHWGSSCRWTLPGAESFTYYLNCMGSSHGSCCVLGFCDNDLSVEVAADDDRTVLRS
jgi:hypothetical protein